MCVCLPFAFNVWSQVMERERERERDGQDANFRDCILMMQSSQDMYTYGGRKNHFTRQQQWASLGASISALSVKRWRAAANSPSLKKLCLPKKYFPSCNLLRCLKQHDLCCKNWHSKNPTPQEGGGLLLKCVQNAKSTLSFKPWHYTFRSVAFIFWDTPYIWERERAIISAHMNWLGMANVVCLQ